MPKKKIGQDFGGDDDAFLGSVEQVPLSENDLDLSLQDVFEEERLYEALVEPKEDAEALLTIRELRRSGDGRILADGSDGFHYLLPKDFEFDRSRMTVLSKDDSRLEKLYTWEKEIDAMLPDRAALVKQIQRSLYLAGAYQKGDLDKNEVKRNWSRSAFPSVIKEIEE